MLHRNVGSTILVVEDDASLRRLIVLMLKSGGFAVLEAGKASEGLTIVRERQGYLDLAIIDIVMPGISGLDLATDLDREFPLLKILYISGYVDSIAADVISRRSPDHMLLKPFDQQALLDRVGHLLQTPVRPRLSPETGSSSGAHDGTSG